MLKSRTKGIGLPNFFILGAPKCGTTSLARWLTDHPNIFIPAIKEPHYFNTDDQHRNIRKRADYEKLFRDVAEQHSAVGEASVWYLSSKVAVKNILESCMNPKFIVMLRNPLEMAPSLHRQNIYGFHEDVKEFRRAWMLQSDRRDGLSIPKTCIDSRHLQYGDGCRLGQQVKLLLEQIDLSSVFFVFLEDLKSDPRKIYLDLLSFLEVPDDGRNSFEARNSAKSHRSRWLGYLIRLGSRIKLQLGITRSFGIDQANLRQVDPEPLDRDLIEMLQAYFAKDIALLSELTHRDLSHWMVLHQKDSIMKEE